MLLLLAVFHPWVQTVWYNSRWFCWKDLFCQRLNAVMTVAADDLKMSEGNYYFGQV